MKRLDEKDQNGRIWPLLIVQFRNFVYFCVMRKQIPILLVAALLALSGCNTLMPILFGIQEIDGYNAEQCDKFYKKLPKDFAFTPIVCNDEQFFQVSQLGADSMQMKDLYQPLKIMYFHGDSLVSLHINCYCPPTLGFNLNWNFNHQFDVFPPATTVPLEGYTVTRTQMQSVFPEIKGEKDYAVLVFWTNMLDKVSRSEIKTVHRNLKKSGRLDDVGAYLINDDIPMTELLHETE